MLPSFYLTLFFLLNLCAAIDSSDDDRPLKASEREKLRILRPFLMDNICLTKGLLNELWSERCISDRHFAAIKQGLQGSLDNDKIREMLDIMERRSYAHYKLFVECFKHTGQPVTDAMEEGGKLK